MPQELPDFLALKFKFNENLFSGNANAGIAPGIVYFILQIYKSVALDSRENILAISSAASLTSSLIEASPSST